MYNVRVFFGAEALIPKLLVVFSGIFGVNVVCFRSLSRAMRVRAHILPRFELPKKQCAILGSSRKFFWSSYPKSAKSNENVTQIDISVFAFLAPTASFNCEDRDAEVSRVSALVRFSLSNFRMSSRKL